MTGKISISEVPVYTPKNILRSDVGSSIEPCWAAVITAGKESPDKAFYVVAANAFARMAAEMGVSPQAATDWISEMIVEHRQDVEARGYGIVFPGRKERRRVASQARRSRRSG